VAQMKSEGLSEAEARARIFMVDRFGLLTDKLTNLLDFQSQLVQNSENLKDWDVDSDNISLLEVVRHAKPTVLIGVSGQPGLFTEEIIREMHAHCDRPIVMPLTNPTSRVEAHPADIINWTDGAALVATGSPFAPVSYKDKVYPIAQCNNSYIFPGIGLAVIASGAKQVTDGMLMAASRALADCSPLATDGVGSLLPDVNDIQGVSKCIAMEVGKAAQVEGVAQVTTEDALSKAIEHNFWIPQYRTYKRTSF
jgi:malate dehydrogenase (oxaloacetate-decarboxylating)